MNGTTALPRRSFGETMRADVWWIYPLLVFGKKRSCRLRERTAHERNNSVAAAFIWGNDARRCLVDLSATRFCRTIDVHRLLHLGGVPGARLFLRQLHLAVLFAGTAWRFPP